MALSKKAIKDINDQIAAELESAHTYKAMAYKLEALGLKVFAKWFHLQAAEEREHAEKFADYLLDRGAEVTLAAIAKPAAKWKSCQDICADALKHEQYITGRINKLMDGANKENDHATQAFLQWFVTEQVEEEASVTELLDMVKMATTAGQLLMLEGRVWRLIEDRAK